MSRFEDFTRRELSDVHFALRMAATLDMGDGTPHRCETLANEAWAESCARTEADRQVASDPPTSGGER